MKSLTRIVALLLVFALMIPSAAAAVVEPDVQPTASAYLQSYSVWLEMNDSVDICFSVYGTGTMAQIGAKRIILQVSADQTYWTNVADFNSLNPQYTASMIRTNYFFCSSSVSYTIPIHGAYYRAMVFVYAGDGTNGDTRVVYTPIRQFP